MKQKLISAIEFVIKYGGIVILLIAFAGLAAAFLWASWGIFTVKIDYTDNVMAGFVWFIRSVCIIAYTSIILNTSLYMLKRKR